MLQRLQRQEVTVERSLLTNRAALHLAIGGEWTEDLGPPAAARTDRSDTDPMETDA